MLQERILNTLDKRDDIDQRKLSKIAGVNESSISRYLNGYDVLNLASVLKIVQYLYPEEEKEIMAEYVLTQKSRNARFALEYCELNNLPDHVEQLIELLSVSVNPVDREWARLYNLILLHKKRSRKMEDLLMEVEVFDPKEIEMKIMKQLLKAFIYVELGDYISLAIHTKYTELYIKKVKSEFLRNCFNIRIGLIMNYVCLFSNDIVKSRYYSNLVLEQEYFKNVKAIAYHHLGHSYLFQDYEKSKMYMEKAIHFFSKRNETYNLSIAKCNFSFLQSYWNIEREFLLPLDNHPNIASYIFYLIKKGDTELASEYLNRVDLASIQDSDKAFHFYYLGLIDKDKDLFYKSVEWFRHVGDRFHINLPIEELRSLGENENILRILIS